MYGAKPLRGERTFLDVDRERAADQCADVEGTVPPGEGNLKYSCSFLQRIVNLYPVLIYNFRINVNACRSVEISIDIPGKGMI